MAYSTVVTRHRTREVGVGDHVVGGDQPIWVQSMTTTNTFDADIGILSQIIEFWHVEEHSCDIRLELGRNRNDGITSGENFRDVRVASPVQLPQPSVYVVGREHAPSGSHPSFEHALRV